MLRYTGLMHTIAFIAVDDGMLDLARRTLARDHADVRLAKGLMGEAVTVAEGLAAHGLEVAISRGATARVLARALPDLSVVDISTSGRDLLLALRQAKARGGRVGVVAFGAMCAGAEEMGDALGMAVSVHPFENEEDIAPRIREAVALGATLVVGGYITAQVAAALGVPCQPVDTGPQSILAAVAEARRIVHARGVEKAKASLTRAVLDFSDNAVVAVDAAGIVTVVNPRAARMLRLDEFQAVGRPAAEVCPGLGLDRALAGKRQEAESLRRVNGLDVLCTTAPLLVSGAVVGALASFHDVRRIQKMEAAVRRRTLSSGHVAAARFQDILGLSPALAQAVSMAADFARTRATVLILGETGCGKELFAQGVHNASELRRGPFVAVNCAALPGQLLESELFGYVPGAFTGAGTKVKPGLFELAHGGSIFLDEIAEMDQGIQAKLLRVLQEKKVMRLGSDQVIPVEVRVLAATNKDLAGLVARGRFRDDLYYRLNVLRLPLPPLRRRLEDIPQLAGHFLAQACGRQVAPALSPQALAELRRHPWPGNVRELQNVMVRVAALCRQPTVSGALVRRLLVDAPHDAGASSGRLRLAGEGDRIRQALAATRGRVSEAAAALGVSRSTLWRRMRALGLG